MDFSTEKSGGLSAGLGDAEVAAGGFRLEASAFLLKKILVPIDFSKCSEKALRYAVPFARQFGAQLTLLHVIPPTVVMQTSDLVPVSFPESVADAEASLEKFRQSAVPTDFQSRCLVRLGNPHVEIVDAARELNIDLLIISTHGYTGLSHMLLGKTVEKVVRRAGCPVLVVREHEHEFVRISDTED